MKLALGTVQFGLSYGVANQSGQISQERANEILKYAWAKGIDTLDTAIAYGESEQCLGNAGVDHWKIVTKLPAIPDECRNISEWVDKQLKSSLERLGVERVFGLLLHNPQQLLDSRGQEIWLAMKSLKERGFVDKVGYSIYNPEELELLWLDFQPDIVQSPYNILDQRLKTTGWLEKLYCNGVVIHVRSVFLQGLLLMSKEQRPAKFTRWNTLWKAWDEYLVEQQLSPIEVCLGFIACEKRIDEAVIGVDKMGHLDEILNSVSVSEELNIPSNLVINDEVLFNPVMW